LVSSVGLFGGGFAGPSSGQVSAANQFQVADLTSDAPLLVAAVREGSDGRQYAVWAKIGYRWLDNNLKGANFSGNTRDASLGVDMQATDTVLLRFAGTIEDSSLDTSFNWGTFDKSGGGATAQVQWSASDWLKLGLLGGFAGFDNDFKSRSSANGSPVTGGTRSTRWLVSPDVSVGYKLPGYRVDGQLSYLYAVESMHAFTDTAGTFIPKDDFYLGQIGLRGRVTYDDAPLAKIFLPYVGVGFQYANVMSLTNTANNSSQTPAADDTQVTAEVGTALQFSNRLAGNLELNTIQGDNFSAYGITGRIKFSF